VSVKNLSAKRTGDNIKLTAQVRARQAYAGVYYGCVALYNSSGDVWEQLIAEFGTLPVGYDQLMERNFEDRPEVTHIRFWLVGPGPAKHESSYRAFVSELIPVQ
jgi:hypothetical protein